MYIYIYIYLYIYLGCKQTVWGYDSTKTREFKLTLLAQVEITLDEFN